MNNQIVIGYWNHRGKAQVLRLLLTFTGLSWKNKIYKGPQQWFEPGQKAKLGLSFPDLPYLIRYCDKLQNPFKLTQSKAISKYIIMVSERKQLLGRTIEDKAIVEMLVNIVQEILNPTIAIFYSKNYQKERMELFNHKIKEILQQLQQLCGNKQFALNELTLADFYISEASYYFQKMYPQQYSEYPCLKIIRNSINNLPSTQQYYRTQNAISEPFLPKYTVVKF